MDETTEAPLAKPAQPRPWRTVYAAGVTVLSRGVLAGLVCGLLIGGVGGRLAMLLLRFTSDDSIRGLDTDDGFAIGAFTTGTIFLILLTTFLGAVGGLLYLGVRAWLPPRGRPLLFGLFGAALGGLLFIEPDGVDFTLIGPRWLAVALFVLLPAAYGIAVSLLTERLLPSADDERRRWRWYRVLPPAVLLVTGPVGMGVLLLVGLIIGAGRSCRVVRLWRSAPVTWLGRGALAIALIGCAVLLAHDVFAVL